MSRRIETHLDEIAARSHKITSLLSAHFPGHRTQSNGLDKRGLAKALGVSHETVYRAVRGIEEVKMETARKLVRLSHENQDAKPLYLTDFLPFLFHDWAVFGVAPDVDDLLS